MIQSKQVLEWQAQARVEGRTSQAIKMLQQTMETRFPAVPPEVLAKVREIREPVTLTELHVRALRSASID